eukprot:2339759-Prymnesium_polylepis.1
MLRYPPTASIARSREALAELGSHGASRVASVRMEIAAYRAVRTPFRRSPARSHCRRSAAHNAAAAARQPGPA